MKKSFKLLGILGVSTSCLFYGSFVFALTLQEVVEHTLKTNPELLASRQQVLSREKEVRAAKGGYLPSIDAELGIGREWTDSPATGGDDVELTRRESALRLRQMIYDGSATSSDVDRQKARYNSALFDTIDTEETISLRATEAYIEVMRQSELLELLESSLDEHKNIYDQMSLRSDAGVGSRSDLDQISARLSLASSNFVAGQNNLQDAISNFYGIVGYIPDASTLVKPEGVAVPNSIKEAIAKAFNNNPQLKSADADIESAKAQYRASKSQLYPTLALEGGRTWNEDIDGIEGKNEDWVIALRLRYNLYNGGSDSARKKQTVYLIEEAKEIRNTTKRQVEEGMRLSWHAYEYTQKQMRFLTTYSDSVVATREAYRKQFNIGKRSLLDLLNTENELLEAKSNYLNASYDQLYSLYRVAQAEGELINRLNIE
ncbi:MAG: adhesin transport system outer membrane protein [Cellvibrionaceae bacterium]|jgi:adhesin transport system outer membrane protein